MVSNRIATFQKEEQDQHIKLMTPFNNRGWSPYDRIYTTWYLKSMVFSNPLPHRYSLSKLRFESEVFPSAPEKGCSSAYTQSYNL